MEDRTLRVDYAFPVVPSGGPGPPRRGVKDRHKPSPTLFVGNLHPEATKEDVTKAFEGFGDIVGVRIGAFLDRSVR
jgi:RNA recognition motif-containing protein